MAQPVGRNVWLILLSLNQVYSPIDFPVKEVHRQLFRERQRMDPAQRGVDEDKGSPLQRWS